MERPLPFAEKQSRLTEDWVAESHFNNEYGLLDDDIDVTALNLLPERKTKQKEYNYWDGGRRRADVTEIQRSTQRALPYWLDSLVIPESSETCQPAMPTFEFNPDIGYPHFALDFLGAVKKHIANAMPNRPVTVKMASISSHVGTRFMQRYSELAHDDVHPRLVFHGSPSKNWDSICDCGLLPPPKLYQGRNHYTDAIWTATSPVTSIGYCQNGTRMFGCALLDPLQKTKAQIAAECGADSEVDGEARQGGGTSLGKLHKIEKKLGKRQHRVTHKPHLSVQSPVPSTPVCNDKSIEHNGDWAVLVRDENLICPVLEISWDQPNAALQFIIGNPNTADEDHALKTLGVAYFGSVVHPDKHSARLLKRIRHRSIDVQRRKLRAVKHSFWLHED